MTIPDKIMDMFQQVALQEKINQAFPKHQTLRNELAEAARTWKNNMGDRFNHQDLDPASQKLWDAVVKLEQFEAKMDEEVILFLERRQGDKERITNGTRGNS